MTTIAIQAHDAELSAAVAASDAGVQVTELHEMADLHAVAGLFATRWGGTSQPHSPLSPNLLRAFSWAGNYVAGAFSDGRLVGACVAFRQQAGTWPTLFSQTTSVLPGAECRGVGYALKLHQRAWALARGFACIDWTFDPLVRRNAYFNLGKLGAVGVKYLVDFYGPMGDSVNGDDASDRMLVRLRLTRGAEPGGVEAERLRADGAPVLLAVGPNGRPLPGSGDGGDLALCQVPADIVRMRRDDGATAAEWRLTLRAALCPAFAQGFVAQSMTPSGWYVLVRRPR